MNYRVTNKNIKRAGMQTSHSHMQNASLCMNPCAKYNMEITSDTTENEKHSSSVTTLPLVSRIDRLEIAMRRLEMKQSSSSSGCSSSGANNNTFSPSSGLTSEHHLGLDLDMALKEVAFKGSLLERIKTLENRLYQLRLRVESDKMEARAKRDQLSSSSCSFPIFTMNNQGRGAYKKHVDAPSASVIINSIESQEEDLSCKGDVQEKPRKQIKKNRKTTSKSEHGDQEKTTRKKKKKKVIREAEREKIKTPNWSPLTILGC